MIVDKTIYMREVSKMLKSYESRMDVSELVKKFEEVYEYASNQKEMDCTAVNLVDRLLEILFKLPTTYMIPYSFINSPVGRVLFSVKFWNDEAVFSTAEIVLIMGRTRSLISHDLKNEVLIGQKMGRKQIIYVYQTDLVNYMVSKNIPREEAIRRIEKYKKLKSMGLDYERIKALMREDIKVVS